MTALIRYLWDLRRKSFRAQPKRKEQRNYKRLYHRHAARCDTRKAEPKKRSSLSEMSFTMGVSILEHELLETSRIYPRYTLTCYLFRPGDLDARDFKWTWQKPPFPGSTSRIYQHRRGTAGFLYHLLVYSTSVELRRRFQFIFDDPMVEPSVVSARQLLLFVFLTTFNVAAIHKSSIGVSINF